MNPTIVELLEFINKIYNTNAFYSSTLKWESADSLYGKSTTLLVEMDTSCNTISISLFGYTIMELFRKCYELGNTKAGKLLYDLCEKINEKRSRFSKCELDKREKLCDYFEDPVIYTTAFVDFVLNPEQTKRKVLFTTALIKMKHVLHSPAPEKINDFLNSFDA